jgi:hypothetical protein
MTPQQVREVPVVIDDPVVHAAVRKAVDELDTVDATSLATASGVLPPTGEPGWRLCQRFAADGAEEPLVWVLVTGTDG